MGVEDYQLIVCFPRDKINSVISYLGSLAEVNLQKDDTFPVYAEYVTEGNIIELEIDERGKRGQFSGRFALCQPDGCLMLLLKLIEEIAQRTKGGIRICDSERKGDLWFASLDYDPAKMEAISAFQLKRDLWVHDFGPERATIRCSEALTRFVQSRH